MNRVYACPVGDLLEGETLRLNTSPVIALFNVDGKFYTVSDCRNHGNAPMLEGHLEDDATAECSLHVASFCSRIGKALCLPAIGPSTTYAVYVDDSDVFVDIPEDAR